MSRVSPSRRRRFRSDATASSAIEFAILAPVFLLMLFGMVAYAIYFGAAHSIQQIAADAARTSIGGLGQDERNNLVTAYIDNNADDYPLIDRARLTYSVADKHDDVSQYEVSVSYDASTLPIWNLFPLIPLPSPTITQTYSIRKGGI